MGWNGMGWNGWMGWNCFFYTKITTIRGGGVLISLLSGVHLHLQTKGGRLHLVLAGWLAAGCWLLVAGDGTAIS